MLTYDQVVYNPVRARRPMPAVSGDLQKWVDQLSENTSHSCDFCNFKTKTAVDQLGR